MEEAAVGTLSIEIFMPENTSLKDRRRIVKSLTDRIGNRFNAAVAETGGLDIWQRAVITVACVSNSVTEVRRHLDTIQRWCERQHDFVLLRTTVQIR